MENSAPVSTPRPWERQDKTREQIAAELGISVRTLRWRWQRQRELAEMPAVEITDGPANGYHYRLDRDEASVLPSGPFRIGDHHGRRQKIQHAGNGQPLEGKAKKPAPKFKPKQPKKRTRPPAAG